MTRPRPRAGFRRFSGDLRSRSAGQDHATAGAKIVVAQDIERVRTSNHLELRALLVRKKRAEKVAPVR